jgi:hypothetical protein
VEHLDRLELEGLDSVEQSLAGPEQDRDHVAREFVDHSGGERLTDGRGAARDVDAILAGRLTRLRVCGLEAWVTKWKLVPPSISIGSRAWWVSTKTGAW